ncbi:MAG: hypothetical protein U0269_02885 [Polyangiales bacterium]
MKETARGVRAALAAFALTALIAGAFAVGFVEDWDGASFALSCESVDLRRFRPHPPGYPLYTLSARALGALGLHAARCAPWLARLSALALAVFSGSVAVLARGSLARRVVTAVAVSLAIPGVLRVGTMVSPMGLALGAWSVAIALGYRAPRSVALCSLCFGAALASRPTDLVAIIGCTIAVASPRMRLARTLLAGVALAALAHGWLIVGVGFQEYLALLARHRLTHASIVDGSRGAAAHASALGGFFAGDRGALGVAAASLTIAVCLATLRSLPARARVRAAVGTSMCVAWVLLAQPAGVERHWLWCGAVCAFALARAVDRSRPRALRVSAASLLALLATCAWIESRSRHATPPAAVQLGRFVRASGGVLFAARAGRAAEVEGVVVYEARHLGELRAIAERLPRWPSRLWVTDEVRSLEHFPDRDWTQFCGPRSARGEAVCVRVRAVDLSGGTREFRR